MSLLEEIRKDVNGALTLADWLGDGGVPVTPELAESRSMACVYGKCGGKCHLNVAPNWWQRFKNTIAMAIRFQLALKHKLGLFVSKENDLAMCRRCGCCLRLKVWTPIGYIKSHLTDGDLEALPSWCWMKQEINQQ